MHLRERERERVNTSPKKSTLSVKIILPVLVGAFTLAIAFSPNYVSAAACQSTATGNWGDSGTWTNCGGTTPQTADTVQVQSGHTVTLNINATTTSVTIDSGGTLTEDGGGRTLSVATGWTNNGTFTAGDSTVVMRGDMTFTGNTTFKNLTIDPNSSASKTITLTGYTATTTGILIFNNSSTGLINLTGGTYAAESDVVWDANDMFAGSTATLLTSGSNNQFLTVNNATITTGIFPAFQINKSGGTLYLTGTIRTEKSWTWINGDVDAVTNSSTVVFVGSSGDGQEITGSHTLNNVIFDPNYTYSGSVFGNTITAGTNLTIAGTLTIDNSGPSDFAIKTGTLIAQGDLSISTLDVNSSYTSFSLLISGSNSQVLTLLEGSETGGTFASTTINKSGGVLTMDGVLRTTKNFTHTAGTVDWTTNDSTLSFAGTSTFSPGSAVYDNIYLDTAGVVTLSGNLSLAGNWTNNGSFTTGSNTVTFTGSSDSTLITGGTTATNDFQNLTVNKSGSGTVQLSTNGLDVDGTLTVTAGALDLNGQNLSTVTTCDITGTFKFTGDETLSCTPTLNTGSTVEYSATSGSRSLKNWNYHGLTLNGSGGTFVSPATLNVAGNFTNTAGTFSHNSGTVVLNGTNQTIAGNTTFNNLTKQVSTARTLTFTKGSTQTIVGTLTLEGAIGQLLSLRSSEDDADGLTDDQWNIDPQGTRAINYADVKDSNNTNATAISVGGTVTDSGTNTNWTITGSDLTAPTVTLTAPVDSDTVHGTTTALSATASDNVGVVGVQFKIDTNTNLGSEDTEAPYSLVWDSTAIADGEHDIIAVARDAAGNYATSTAATVIVQNTSITQYGITWQFDGPYDWGQFANGDYWVVGPVTITSITPDFAQYNFGGTLEYINGWEVNPSVIDKQGFDQRASYWDATKVPSLPYAAQAGESILKADGYEEAGLNCNTDPYATNNGPCLYTAAVLTVVATTPPNNGTTVFRPPYFGTDKPYYSTTTLQTNLLPSLASVSGTPTLSWVETRFKRVQLDHIGVGNNIYGGAFLHPDQNMEEYPANNARDVADAVLRLSLNDSVDDKMPALIPFLQSGIDYYHMYTGGMSWWAGGGYSMGRKLPVTLFALLNGDSEIQTTVRNIASNDYNAFGEDGSYYFSSVANDNNGMILFGNPEGGCSESVYWGNLENGSGQRDCKDPYGYIDGGEQPGGSYQSLNVGATRGTSLVVRLISGLRDLWSYQPFFDYAERWVTVGGWSQPDPCAPYDGNSANRGVTYGPDGNGGCILDTNPVDGIGRFPDSQGLNINSNLYGSTFALNMWTAYDSTVDISPPIITAVATGTPNSTSITVTWSTNESADSQVEYGPTTSYGSQTLLDEDLVTSHSVILSGLSPSTTYHFRARSSDAQSNLASSTDAIFTTTSSPDPTPPALSSGSPSGSLPADTTQTILQVSTDESATCKYGPTANTAYASIVNTFSTTGGTTHTQTLTGLTPGTSYTYYVRCTDGSNPNLSDYSVSFSISSLSSNAGPTIVASGSSRRFSPTPTTPSPTPPTTFFRDLTLTSSGPDVRSLQIFLNTHGYPITPTGPGSLGQETLYFGPATQAALIRYQQAKGITPALGYFGPITRASLGATNSPSTTPTTPVIPPSTPPLTSTSQPFTVPLYLGLTHPDILRLQQILNTDPDTRLTTTGPGSLGQESPYFGPLTLEAVKRFQLKYLLAELGDPGFGYVGPKTRAKLGEVGN